MDAGAVFPLVGGLVVLGLVFLGVAATVRTGARGRRAAPPLR